MLALPSSLKLNNSDADKRDMRREIGLWVEWNWSQGLLSSKCSNDELLSWGRALAHALKRQKPSRFGSIEESSQHIALQIRSSLRALSYGDRDPSAIHPKRMSYLRETFESTQALLPNFVTHLS